MLIKVNNCIMLIHALLFLGRKRGNPAGEPAPGKPAQKKAPSGKKKKTKPR